MTDEHAGPGADASIPIAVSTGISTLLGALVGVFFSFGWADPPAVEWSSGLFLWKVFCGAMIGGVSSLIIGGLLAWHAGTVAVSGNQADFARMWGLFTGALIGLSLGPAFGGAFGLFVGYPVEGAVWGIFIGWLVGLIAWQAAFHLADTASP